AQALGHPIDVSHHYAITMNGIAASLTPDEAGRVARMPGIASVRASRKFALDAANPKLLSEVDCTSTDAAGLCNGDDPEAEPGNGHGVHTASTAAGNTLDASANPPPSIPPPHTFMSGVASCAQVR